MIEWIKKRENLISSFIYRLLWNFKRIIFFLSNIWDFRFDFPIPPKRLKYRMLFPSFWSTLFHVYMVRKTAAKKYDHNVKNMWSNKHFKQEKFEKWLYKVFNTQYGSVIDQSAFEIICHKDTKRIFEAGCGNGAAAACLLLRLLDNRFPSGIIESSSNSIEFTGVDLKVGHRFESK